MYNPKPQTRNEIMWAAMAGRDFDLEEKGRFEMFMSDVAERINEGGGGSFVVDMTFDEGGDPQTDVPISDIVSALSAGKTVMLKIVEIDEYDDPEDPDAYERHEYISYYIVTHWQVNDGELEYCIAVCSTPEWSNNTKSYRFMCMTYKPATEWQIASYGCSPQVLTQLINATDTSTYSSALIKKAFGIVYPEWTSAQKSALASAFESAVDSWKTLATANGGKQCVYANVISGSDESYTDVRNATISLINAFKIYYGVLDASAFSTSVFGGSNGTILRPVEAQTERVVFQAVLDGPLGIPYNITISFEMASQTVAIKIIGSLPIDA